MSLASILGLSLLAATIAVLYPGLEVAHRTGNFLQKLPPPQGIDRCLIKAELQGCEDIVIHHASGWAFLSCGNPERRLSWWPPMNVRKDISKEQVNGEVWAYNLETEDLKQLQLDGPPAVDFHALAFHASKEDPEKLHFFIANHRALGSVVEIYTHTLGSSKLTHETTYMHTQLKSPNSIVPVSPNSFYVSNDFGTPTGPGRLIELLLRRKGGNVQFHTVDHGGRVVIKNLRYPNGLAHGFDEKRDAEVIFVCSTTTPELIVYERDKEHERLKERSHIALPSFCDNVAVDPQSGHIYTAGVVNPLKFLQMVKVTQSLDMADQVGGRVMRIRNNTGEDVFYGHKYKVETILVSGGSFLPGGWSIAAPDEKRGVMLVGGPMAKGVAICKI